MQRLKTRVRESLIDWEPRVDVLDVKVASEPASPGELRIEIRYRVRATNARENLVYPFYLQEGSAA